MKFLLVVVCAIIAVQGQLTKESQRAALKECVAENDAKKYAHFADLNQLPTDDHEVVKVFECYWKNLNLIVDDKLNFDIAVPMGIAAIKIKHGITIDEKQADEEIEKCKSKSDQNEPIGIRAIHFRNCLFKRADELAVH